MRAQLDSLEANVAIHGALIQSMRHTLDRAAQADAVVPSATPVAVTEPRCEGIERCGLKDEDARQSRANFGRPHAWLCAGCGHEAER